MKKKIVEQYKFTEFGFPVMLKNIEIVTNGSHSYPKIKTDALSKKVLLKLANTNEALTGAKLKYIRQYLDYSTRGLSELLGVSYSTVLRWQEKGQERTRMNYCTEILIKSVILINLSKDEKSFYKQYSKLIAIKGELKEPADYISI